MKTIETERAIESIGYKVMATTKHPTGMSFDAHRVVGKRKLVRGPVSDTHGGAMMGLYIACLQN
jgi:hypothetical protein